MASDRRTLIDFATGENWEMPLHLYEKYEKDFLRWQLQDKLPINGCTVIQHWLTTLVSEERELISRR